MRCHRFAPIHLALVSALWGMLLLTGGAEGQPPPTVGLPLPRLLIVSPNGARAGGTVDVTITGTDLDEPQGLLFSQPGFQAELAKEPEVKIDPKDPKKKPPKKKGQIGPTMSVTYKVTVPSNAPVGMCDLRLVNSWGLSNPRVFVVGDLNDVLEKEPNNDVDQAQRVELNTTVNGVIAAPTDVDYYVFKGGKGQRVVFSCLAESIESRLHPAIELFDAAGKKLGANRDYRGTDALLDCILPADGDYYVRLFQFTHLLGGTDYFYRLSISTAPWIDAIFPPVVEPGKAAQLTVYGRNLPGGQPDPTAVIAGSVLEKITVPFNVPNDPAALQRLAFSGHVPPMTSGLDGVEYRIKNGAGASNPFLLTLARSPVILDDGKNSTRATAQPLNAPCEIAGRLDKAHSQAWYTFTAKKGDSLGIELAAERLGSPIDLALSLFRGDSPNPMVELDDVQPNDADFLSPTQFFTRTADPARYPLKAPADGKYFLLVKSQEGTDRAGPRQLYRLRVAPEQPDFRLVVMPASPHLPDAGVVRQGGNQEFAVFIWRRDGFQSNIALSIDGLPPGVTCKPQQVGPALKQSVLVVSAAPDAAAWAGEIKVKGTATVNGQTLVREARAASLTWAGQPQQQNVPLISRIDRALVLAVREKAPFVLTVGQEKASVSHGDKVTLPLKVQRLWPDLKAPVQMTALGMPEGMTFANTAIAKDDGSLVLNVSPRVAPGHYNIVFRGTTAVPFHKDPMAKTKPNVNVSQASNPITLTVVPKQLATVVLNPPNPTVKIGAQAKVIVQVKRLFDYPGEFKVALVLPPNVKGLQAPEVVIPAGKDETELIVHVASDAPPGNQTNLLIRVTALFDGSVPIQHEAKLAINVQK